MKRFASTLSCLHLVSLLFVAAPAFADIPAPNACDDEGASCDTAGDNADEPGTCKTSTCSRATPDGTMEYECLLCEATGNGTGGGNGAAGDSSTNGSGSDDSDDGGCAVAPGPVSTSVGFAALTTFALAFAALRRRAGARVR